LQCALWHHLVETTHWHSLFFFGAVLSTTHSKHVRFLWVTLYFSSVSVTYVVDAPTDHMIRCDIVTSSET